MRVSQCMGFHTDALPSAELVAKVVPSTQPAGERRSDATARGEPLRAAALASLRLQPEQRAAWSACGLRLILRTMQLELIAADREEADAWVCGINRLPVGSKGLALRALVKKAQMQA